MNTLRRTLCGALAAVILALGFTPQASAIVPKPAPAPTLEQRVAGLEA